MTPVERVHIARALRFELGKVETRHVRVAMLDQLERLHPLLASQVALGLGEEARAPKSVKPSGAFDDPAEMELLAGAQAKPTASGGLTRASALSQMEQPMSARGRKVAILVSDGVDGGAVKTFQQALEQEGVKVELVAPHQGKVGELEAKQNFSTTHASVYDAVIAADGSMNTLPEALDFVRLAYLHAKPVGAIGNGQEVLDSVSAQLPGTLWDTEHGVSSTDAAAFVKALAQHRYWNRAPKP